MSGKHYSWLINPQTGDYVIEDGSPVRDESLQFPAYARIKTEKEKWMYAPSRDYGNSLVGLGKRQTTTPGLARKLIEKALAPILNDGRASEIEVDVSEVTRYGISTIINIIDENNQDQTIELRQVNI